MKKLLVTFLIFFLTLTIYFPINCRILPATKTIFKNIHHPTKDNFFKALFSAGSTLSCLCAQKILYSIDHRHQLIKDLDHVTKPIKKDIDQLKKEFYNPFKQKNDWPLLHILGIDYALKNGIINWSGFHHDHNGILEKAYPLIRITGKKAFNDGFYAAYISVAQSTWKRKTFFPQHWTRKEVMEYISKTYADTQFSSYLIIAHEQGYIKLIPSCIKNMKLLVYINKNGTIKSCYPLLK